MHRRLFIKGIGLVGVGSLATPQVVLADTPDPMSAVFAGSLYYAKVR